MMLSGFLVEAAYWSGCHQETEGTSNGLFKKELLAKLGTRHGEAIGIMQWYYGTSDSGELLLSLNLKE